jgi:hypothetical protein
MAFQDKFVDVDGPKTRYIEDAFERATLLKEKFSQLDLHIVDNCKHLVQWHAMDRSTSSRSPFCPNSAAIVR